MTHVWERPWVGGLADPQLLAEGNPNHCDTVISRPPPWSPPILTASAFSVSPGR